MSIAEAALPYWGLQGADVALIAERENAVYKVTHRTGTFALRLHRKGYRTDSQLAGELDWMAWLDRAGLSVPAPVPKGADPSYIQRFADEVIPALKATLSGN